MSKARLVITAVIVERRRVSEVARTYGVARSWIYKLLARYAAEGEAAFGSRSRRPKTHPGRHPEKRPAQPPPDPGQGRKIPADPAEMAARPAARRHHRRPAGPVRHPHRSLQQPPPHRAPAHRSPPAIACNARPKAAPGDRATDAHHRVRAEIIGATGTVTLRHAGKLHHIGIGRPHAGTHVLLLIRDLHIRIIDAATGELLRELTLDPTRNYQPNGPPPGPTPATPRKPANPEPQTRVRGVLHVLRHHTVPRVGLEPTLHGV
jgi:leucine-zipper of insertion element IS481